MTPKELINHPHRMLLIEKMERVIRRYHGKKDKFYLTRKEIEEFLEAGQVIVLEEKKLGH